MFIWEDANGGFKPLSHSSCLAASIVSLLSLSQVRLFLGLGREVHGSGFAKSVFSGSLSPALKRGNVGRPIGPLRLGKWVSIFFCPIKVRKSLCVQSRSDRTCSLSPCIVSALLLVFKCIFVDVIKYCL